MLVPWLFSVWLVSSLQSKNTIEKAGGGSRTGRLREVFGWKQMDYAYPTQQERDAAMKDGSYVPENNLPLGLEIWRDYIFITIPRWRGGVPATVTYVNRNDNTKSPLLQPFPDWSWHQLGNCDGLTSVFRMSVDTCGRLWVMDSGAIDLVATVNSICPPQIFVFDLNGNNRLVRKFVIPKDQAPEGALFANIVVDIKDGVCDEAFAYVSDVFRYGLVVYSFAEDRSWRIEHPYFYPDPLVCRYEVDDIIFRWTDGLFGLALSPEQSSREERYLYFHPMSSFREFVVPTSTLRHDNITETYLDHFEAVGEPRGESHSHASGSAMDRNGVLYYNMVSNDAVACWNSKNYHSPKTQGIVEKNKATLSFPNDLKVDQDPVQNLWVLSNRLHRYMYRGLNQNEINFRVLSVSTRQAVKGTVCQPGLPYQPHN